MPAATSVRPHSNSWQEAPWHAKSSWTSTPALATRWPSASPSRSRACSDATANASSTRRPRGPAGEREPPDHTYDYRDLLRQLRDDYPEVVYFMAWMDSFALARQNGAAELLRDDRVLTRETLARQP